MTETPKFVDVTIDLEAHAADGTRIFGQVAEYSEGEKAHAIRINCGRSPIGCPAFADGKCVTQMRGILSHKEVTFDADVECGATEEGLGVVGSIRS